MQIQVRRNVRGFAFGLVVALLASGILAAAGGGVVQAVQAAGSGGGGSDEGLVAEWRFDEGAGSVLHDSSGNGNDGTIHGASWTAGKFGNALRFDGQDDFVDCGNDASLSWRSADYSVCAWAKRMSTGSYDVIVGKQEDGGNYRGWYLRFNSRKAAVSDIIEFATGNYDRSWNGNGAVRSDGTYTDTNWHYICGVLDGKNSKARLYVDGVEIKNDAGSNTYNIDNSVSLRIGAKENGEYFNGKIDEVRIYNRALTAEEIKQHYEGKQAELTLTKSVSPHTIKQGQTTTVTLTVENTGTTELRDIEVADEVPAAADLTFVSGETAKKYASLKPEDTRVFQYILETKEAGRFNLGEATATYADEDGNYQTAKSNTATLEVIPALPSPTGSPSAPAPAPTSSPSTPGFEAVFAVVAGLLGVAFVLRGRR